MEWPCDVCKKPTSNLEGLFSIRNKATGKTLTVCTSCKDAKIATGEWELAGQAKSITPL